MDTIIAGSLTNIFYYITLCIAFGSVVGISVWFAHFTKAKFIQNTMFRIKSDLTKGIINKDVTDFQDENSAKFISMLNADVNTLEEKYYNNIIAIFDSILTFLFAIILLIRINFIIAIISVILSSLPILIPKLFTKSIVKAQQNISEKTAKYNSIIKDIFGGFEIVKSYCIGERISKISDDSVAELEYEKANFALKIGKMAGFNNLISLSVQFSLMIFSSLLITFIKSKSSITLDIGIPIISLEFSTSNISQADLFIC